MKVVLLLMLMFLLRTDATSIPVYFTTTNLFLKTTRIGALSHNGFDVFATDLAYF